MSIQLNGGTIPVGLDVRVHPSFIEGQRGGTVFIGDYELPMEDFLLVARYALLNTNIEGSNDPRIAFVEEMKKGHLVDGYPAYEGRVRINPHDKRYAFGEVQPHKDYELVSARDISDDWKAYHGIRYRELFLAKGRGNIYDPTRPEEDAPNNFPLLLKYNGQGVGTTRLDCREDGKWVIRLVAVQKVLQGLGHGRELANRVEDFARNKGAQKLHVNADPNAVGYYEKLGYSHEEWDPSELSGISVDSVQMSKVLN